MRRRRRSRVVRQLTPAEDGQALLRDGLDVRDRRGALVAVDGQETVADRVVADLGQFEVDDRAEERVGDLRQDADPVAVVGFSSLGASVVEVAQHGQCVLHDFVALASVQVDHKADAAGVVLIGGVIKTLR